MKLQASQAYATDWSRHWAQRPMALSPQPGQGNAVVAFPRSRVPQEEQVSVSFAIRPPIGGVGLKLPETLQGVMKRPSVARVRADPALVALFRALADPVRLAALDALAEGDLAAGELAERLRVSPSRLANHLARLLADGLVEVEAQGRSRVYALRHPELTRFLRRAGAMAALAEAARGGR